MFGWRQLKTCPASLRTQLGKGIGKIHGYTLLLSHSQCAVEYMGRKHPQLFSTCPFRNSSTQFLLVFVLTLLNTYGICHYLFPVQNSSRHFIDPPGVSSIHSFSASPSPRMWCLSQRDYSRASTKTPCRSVPLVSMCSSSHMSSGAECPTSSWR